MKILFVNPHFKIGGIASSLYNLLEEIKQDDSLDIDVVSFNPYVDQKFNSLATWVSFTSPFLLKCSFISIKEAIKNLKVGSLFFYFLIKVFTKLIGDNKYRKFICKYVYSKNKKEYDVAICFSNDIPLKGANFGCNDYVEHAVNSKNKISYIHNDLDRLGITRNYILDRYKNFDKVVNVSNSCKDKFDQLAPEYTSKSLLAHNYMNPKQVWTKGEERFTSPFKEDMINFITVARLDNSQKRIDRIISVSKRLKENGFTFSWHILGNGQDLEYLKSLAIKEGVTSCVHFLGFVQNPYPFVKNADCFVLTSDFEAQGMVISEALILGTPVVTTNFDAAKEFVIPLKNGFITEKSNDAIYSILEGILKNPSMLAPLKKTIGLEQSVTASKEALAEFYNLLQ